MHSVPKLIYSQHILQGGKLPLGVFSLLVCLAALLGSGCVGPHGTVPPEKIEDSHATGLGARIVATAREQTGVGYQWGGTSPEKGFDCSGLVWWVFRQHGIGLPRTTRGQIRSGTGIGPSEVLPGDLVFFTLGSGLHAGVVTGAGTFVHSPKSGGRVREEPLWSQYWSQRFLAARRVI